ncbi:hypothetical protein K7432_009630, partial [Basidiobolus ranarum]
MSRSDRTEDMQCDIPMEFNEDANSSMNPNFRGHNPHFNPIRERDSAQISSSPSSNGSYSLPRLVQLDSDVFHAYQPRGAHRLNSIDTNYETTSSYSGLTRTSLTNISSGLPVNQRPRDAEPSLSCLSNRDPTLSYQRPDARYYPGATSQSSQQHTPFSLVPGELHNGMNSITNHRQVNHGPYPSSSNPRATESSNQINNGARWSNVHENSPNFNSAAQTSSYWNRPGTFAPRQAPLNEIRVTSDDQLRQQSIHSTMRNSSSHGSNYSVVGPSVDIHHRDHTREAQDVHTSAISTGASRELVNKSNEMGFETLVKRYFWQVMYGCSLQRCTNRYCASNPAFKQRDPNEAAALSLTLAEEGKTYMCPDIANPGNDLSMQELHFNNNVSRKIGRDTFDEFTSTDTQVRLQMGVLRSMVSEGHFSKNYKLLDQALYCTFGNVDNLSSSFSQTNPELRKICPVDLISVKQAYEMVIQQCPKRTRNAILSGTMLLFEKLLAKVELIEEQHLIIFLMVLMNPLLMDPVEHHDIMPKLCDVLLSLPLPFHKRLCDYISAPLPTDSFSFMNLNKDPNVPHPVTCEYFQHYVSVFQQFITMRLLLRTDENITPNRNEAVMKATKCLEIFYVLNEEKCFIPFTEFYNDAINEQIEIKEDFPRYKTKDGFSFCNHPFILNPATKSDILKVESMVQMRHELQNAFFRALLIGVNSPYLVLEIRRSDIIRDALFQLEAKSTEDLKKQLRVQFVGEEGVDEGGVQKEFFQLVVSEMFDRKYGMFTFNEESRSCWFISNPLVDEAQLEEYRLIGRLIGLAIYNSVILDVRFSLGLYKKLMGQKVSITDLKSFDPMLVHGLEQLLEFEGDVVSAFERTFQIENEYLDGRYTYDLKPGGEDIKLTEENKKEFVDLYVDFILNKSIEKQFDAFKEGFDNVCAGSAIQLFRPEEVEQLICGSSDLDFEALERVTQYDGGFSKDSSVIKNFWEIVHRFTEEQKKKLLFLATGTARVPIGGLSKLQFVIAKNGGDSN